MYTKGLRKWALLLTFWVAMQFSRVHGQTSDPGPLTITGNAENPGDAYLEGNTLTLGGTDSSPGLEIFFDSTHQALQFNTYQANIWAWQMVNSGSTSLQLQMTLDANNKLSLYNSSGSANVVLSPAGTSTFSNSITVNGTDNEMPNQTLVNSNSVLTRGLADDRYLSVSTGALAAFSTSSATGSDAISLGVGSVASGANSFVAGLNNIASGEQSVAFGYGTTASGQNAFAAGTNASATGADSFAMGLTVASGPYSAAFGNASAGGAFSAAFGASAAAGNASFAANQSYATGYEATSFGLFSTASGYYSFASGLNTTAAGYSSVSMGNFTTAASLDSVAIGAYNVGGGDPQNWNPSDPLFEIGNGMYTAGHSNSSYSGYYSATYPTGEFLPPNSGYTGIYPLWEYPGMNRWNTTNSGYYVTTVSSGYVPPSTQYSDALIVLKNGNTAVAGTLSAGSDLSTGGNLSVAGTASATNVSATSVSASNVTTTGSVTAGGTVTASSIIITSPTSDIPPYQGN